MSFRYSRAWTSSGLGHSLVSVFGWQHAAPRVGNLYPGITDPLPDLSMPIPRFSECVEDAAARLLSRSEEFVVLWSGGMDSTMVALVLAARKAPHQRVYITLSNQSVGDSSSSVKDALYALGCLPMNMSISNLHEAVNRGALIVNGSHADSITLGEFADAGDLHDAIWDMTMEELVAFHMGIDKSMAAYHLRRLQPLFDTMPLEQTVLNKALWIDFTCCWSRDEYDFTYRFDLGEPNTTHCSFFNTDLFQRWAVQDARVKLVRGDSKHMIRAQCELEAGAALSFKKNLLDPTLNSSRYQQLYLPTLLAIRENYSLVFDS